MAGFTSKLLAAVMTNNTTATLVRPTHPVSFHFMSQDVPLAWPTETIC